MKAIIKHTIAATAACMALAMQPAAAQQMVVVGNDGSRTPFNLADITGVSFEEQHYDEANVLLTAIYTAKGDKASYIVDFGNDQADAGGDPAKPGDFQVSLALIAPTSEVAANAILPAGTYKAGNGTEPMTFDASATASFFRDESGEVVPHLYIGGTVTVSYSGDTYQIYCDLEGFDGTELHASYSGPIKFSVGVSSFDKFEGHHDITFDGGQGRYYGNWFNPFADDMTLQFYTGDFGDNNQQVEGYWLSVDFYTPKYENPMDPKKKIVDGVYNIDTREKVMGDSYIPFTFRVGSEVDLWGTTYPTGTYITYINRNGSRALCYIKGGTITVSDNGSKFAFDLEGDNGVTIKATCQGMNLQSFCDNDKTEPQRPYSSLDKDITIKPADNAVAIAYSMGDYIIEGMESYILMITDPAMKKGHYLSFDILTSDATLVDGTYTVSNSLEDKTIFKGRIDFAKTMSFSWFGDLDTTDADGYQDVLAPIDGGTITIENLSGGKLKVTFDLTDDNGHKLTGEWTGDVVYAADGTISAPRKMARRVK